MKKFSIILPVRNGGNYLKECVNSILAQTLNNFNLIILDNCSTDGSLEWIQSLADDRILIYPSTTPLTIEENWGRIISVSKNEFVTLIGHDDLLLPNYLATMDMLIQKHPEASLYQTHFNFINATGQLLRPCLPMDEIQYSHEFLAFHLNQTLDSMGTGYMFRSKDYAALGGMPNYPDLIFGDYELWMKLTAISYKATSIENCFSYRKHKSLSSTTKGNNYQKSFHRYMLFLKKIIELDIPTKIVVERYAKEMLYFYCEKIAHRLLKTPRKDNAMHVAEFITLCKTYANWLIPSQVFEPEKKQRINAAKIIDNNLMARSLFLRFKKVSSRFR